ncbi:MAG: fumarylacetoacetate hydrolase family protein [Acidobacteria bacterium]|nr:fumarylacetoacetate hydrolase family protein [Acidobacteriota bacterium]
MKFVTFARGGPAEPGVIRDAAVVSLEPSGFPDLLSVIAAGAEGLRKAAEAARTGAAVPLESVKLLAPIPRPPKIICIGLNYRDHAIESKMEIPSVPTVFSKYATAVIGPGDNIVLPRNSVKPDYEAEFAVVIGRGGRHIAAGSWKEHVFGYTILNDVSARDYQMATSQWMIGKTFDTFAPIGPWVVSAEDIPDPHALDISLAINGQVLQKSNTRELIFRVPDLIAHLSGVFTLEPGDVISTGTPSGVGFSHKPPRWLRPGDDVAVRVEGIGELRNRCVAEEQQLSAAT